MAIQFYDLFRLGFPGTAIDKELCWITQIQPTIWISSTLLLESSLKTMFYFLFQRNGNNAVIRNTISQYLTILLVKCTFTKQNNPCINPSLTLNILSRSGSPIHLNALIPFIIHQIIITNWTLCWDYKNNNNHQALKCAPGGHHHHATKITTIHFTWNSWPQTRLKCSPIRIKPPLVQSN